MSYQFAVLNADSGKLTTLIVYPKDGKRISLENGLTRALLKARRKGVIDKVPSRFIIAGHFTRADLTTFADFGLLQAAHRCGAEIICDDRTTAPAVPGVVRRAGQMQRHDRRHHDAEPERDVGWKRSATCWACQRSFCRTGIRKDRMDLFLQDHPELFEKYALTDAIIPARWVATDLQAAAGAARHQQKVITLGGAAVELVTEAGEEQRDRPEQISRTRENEATAGAPGAADRDRRAGVSWRIQRRHRAGLFSRRERTGGPRHQVGLPDGAVVHRRSRLAQRAALHRAGPAGGHRRGDDGSAGRIQVSRRNEISMPAGQGIERQRAGLPAGRKLVVHRTRTGRRHQTSVRSSARRMDIESTG